MKDITPIRQEARVAAGSAEAPALLRDTRGSVMVEYMILAGVVAILSIQAFSGFAGKVDKTMNEQVLDPAKMGF